MEAKSYINSNTKIDRPDPPCPMFPECDNMDNLKNALYIIEDLQEYFNIKEYDYVYEADKILQAIKDKVDSLRVNKEVYMTELERIKNELNLAGYRLEPVPDDNWTDDDYVQNIGNCAWEICKMFCEQGHSGMSAGYTLELIKTLLDGKTLTPLTDNPEEWTNCSGYCEDETKKYQSKRNFGCFSEDNLKTYYDINAEENKHYEFDENGNKTGWSCFVGRDRAVKHELKHYEG